MAFKVGFIGFGVLAERFLCVIHNVLLMKAIIIHWQFIAFLHKTLYTIQKKL